MPKVGFDTRCESRLISVLLMSNALGVHTFATARDEKALEDLKSLGIEPLSLEVTSSEQISAARSYIERRTGGKLDILVNNAFVPLTIIGLLVKLIKHADLKL